jgi:DNA-binding CsgD family transcriptional regulator
VFLFGPAAKGLAMKSWQEDLLCITERPTCEQEVFEKLENAATALGFTHCAYGLRLPHPLSNPKTIMLNNYPQGWRERYASQGYLKADPTVLHGRQSQKPLIWSDNVFEPARKLWEEARSFGLCVGWAQSSLDAVGVGGMLTLSRPHDPLTSAELESQEIKMRWLVNIAHLSLSRIFNQKVVGQRQPDLTGREIEILKWTGDGKTSGEISDLLSVSENTVKFHIKNAVAKLQTANKTAAVVRAAMLGLLN